MAATSTNDLHLWDKSNVEESEPVTGSVYEELLNKSRWSLCKNLQLDLMWRHLRELGVISKVTEENINRELLDLISHGPRWRYHAFMRSIARSGQSNLIPKGGIDVLVYEDNAQKVNTSESGSKKLPVLLEPSVDPTPPLPPKQHPRLKLASPRGLNILTSPQELSSTQVLIPPPTHPNPTSSHDWIPPPTHPKSTSAQVLIPPHGDPKPTSSQVSIPPSTYPISTSNQALIAPPPCANPMPPPPHLKRIPPPTYPKPMSSQVSIPTSMPPKTTLTAMPPKTTSQQEPMQYTATAQNLSQMLIPQLEKIKKLPVWPPTPIKPTATQETIWSPTPTKPSQVLDLENEVESTATTQNLSQVLIPPIEKTTTQLPVWAPSSLKSTMLSHMPPEPSQGSTLPVTPSNPQLLQVPTLPPKSKLCKMKVMQPDANLPVKSALQSTPTKAEALDPAPPLPPRPTKSAIPTVPVQSRQWRLPPIPPGSPETIPLVPSSERQPPLLLWDKKNRDECTPVLNSIYAELLNRSRVNLHNNLQLDAIWPHLRQLSVLKLTDEERLKATAKSRPDQVLELLNFIERGPRWHFHALMRAMALTGQESLILSGEVDLTIYMEGVQCDATLDFRQRPLPSSLLHGIWRHCLHCRQSLMKAHVYNFERKQPEVLVDVSESLIHVDPHGKIELTRAGSRYMVTVPMKGTEILQELGGTSPAHTILYSDDSEATFGRDLVFNWSINFLDHIVNQGGILSLKEGSPKWTTMVFVKARSITNTVEAAIRDHLGCKKADEDELMAHIQQGEGVVIVVDNLNELHNARALENLKNYVQNCQRRQGPTIVITCSTDDCSIDARFFDRVLQLKKDDEGLQYV